MFEARADNYVVKDISHIRGRAYSLTMDGQHYNAVVLYSSFDYYELRYHLAKVKPDLIICFHHNTVVPIPVLSLKAGRFAKEHELPEEIKDIREQRVTKVGSRVLLGMYLSGIRLAQDIIKDLKPTTKARYLQKAKDLSRRKRGRPVDTQQQKDKQNERKNTHTR
jgi:hypothetical protein